MFNPNFGYSHPQAFPYPPPYWSRIPLSAPYLPAPSSTEHEIENLQRLKSQLEQEINDLKRQRDQLLEGNRILIEELPVLPGASASSSFSTAQPFVKLKTKSFEQIILETLVAEISEPLPRIRGKIDPSENRVEYYKQFLPFILAEIKEEVNKQEETIRKKRLAPFIAKYRIGTPSNRQEDAITRIIASLKQKDLPKLGHGFFKELVKIIFTEKSQSRKSSSSKEKHDEWCVYAVASAGSHSEDDENENKNAEKVIDLEITLSTEDLELIHQKNITSFKIHWLAGLIPTERMYLACLHMPHPSFEDQFIHADLPEWPDIDRSIVSVDAVQPLNPSQRDCVMKLASTTHGLYLLQGPPGTGKTTTAAALIVQLAKQYPEKSLMVCAPSNQAIRELLRRVHALAPDILMALIGVGKDLPEAFNEIYVHKFTKTLYEPLISLKRKLRYTDPISITEKMKTKVLAACRQVSEKIGDLLDQPTLFECKFQTRRDLSTLNSFCLGMCDKLANSNVDLIEILEEYITEIQNTSYAFEEYLTQRAQIVFATLVASGRPWLQKQRGKFDILIVDEAAQALLPEVIIPHKFNPTLCVQIGDPQQLAPTITLREAQANGYADSMMYKLMLDYQQPHEMLRIQYRMHEQICRWISRQFYEGHLETDPGVSARESILTTNSHLDARLKRPSLFFDIRTGRRQREISASSRNDAEANAVVNLACYLLFTCDFLPEDIGIITFYAAQVALIKDLFDRALYAFIRSREQTNAIQKKLLIHTVDGFQGGERKVTLVSVVQTSESVGFLNDLRRLNVGMSRAQEARWIFGSFEPLSQSNSVLPSLLTELQQEGLIVEEEELSGICNLSFRK